VEQRSEILGRFRVNSTPKKTKGKKEKEKKKRLLAFSVGSRSVINCRLWENLPSHIQKMMMEREGNNNRRCRRRRRHEGENDDDECREMPHHHYQ
jgi:hypothetical protein